MNDIQVLGRRRLRIVLPGGSGQVGQMLARFFQERGHFVTLLTRGPYTAPWETVHWDGKETGPWVEALEEPTSASTGGTERELPLSRKESAQDLRVAHRDYEAIESRDRGT